MNWGYRVMIVLGLFMAFIGTLSYFMMKSPDDTIESDYYEKGLNYSQDYNKLQNTLNKNKQPEIAVTANSVVITFKEASNCAIKLFRPSDKTHDLQLKAQQTDSNKAIVLNRAKLENGLWRLQLAWKDGAEAYQFEKEIMLQ